MRSLAIIAIVVAVPQQVHAFDSECRAFLRKCDYGPDAARNPWVDDSGRDEHRLIWNKAHELGGLPDSLSWQQAITAFTGDNKIRVRGRSVPSYQPVAFEETSSTVVRRFYIGEFSQLPDFSYAVWDWVLGNEQCPVPEIGGNEDCHDFASHLGLVNLPHFPPQSQYFYARLHRLALRRAVDCQMMYERVQKQSRFNDYISECEIEAMIVRNFNIYNSFYLTLVYPPLLPFFEKTICHSCILRERKRPAQL